MLLPLVAVVFGVVAADALAIPTWWQHGEPPYALEVPTNLATTAAPIWHPNSTDNTTVQFVLARTEFTAKPFLTAVAFVTAQQSPLCQPDPRLAGNDYGSCIPAGGSSQPKLLGAYKLFVNGVVVAMGPGRRVNQTQGVDAVDVSSVVRQGPNAIGLQGFHTSKFSGDEPRLLLQIVLHHTDGSTTSVATGPQWRTMNGDQLFNPQGSTGAWAGHNCAGSTCSGMPQEWLDLRLHPTGWDLPGFREDDAWLAAAPAPPFVLPLVNRPARPVAVYSRAAVKVTRPPGCQGCFVFDYGRELQGGVNLTFFNATGGERVKIGLSEELDPSGVPLVPMRTTNNFSSVWTLAPVEEQTAMQHEYMEFRYAMVAGVSHQPRASAWVLRYPMTDAEVDLYGDEPTLKPPSPLRRPAKLATLTSGNATLDAVWGLVRYTALACGGLDINVDSNTRQRDFCATDAFITGLGQLALSSDYGMPTMTAMNGFQVDSNIWQGMTDFRSALISLAYQHALYSGDLSLIRQRWEDIKKHSFVHFFDGDLGLVIKPIAFMGSHDCKCPESWSPAGLPPGVYEAVECTCTDLNDWPLNYQDGYKMGNVSSVANAYIAHAASLVSQMARWLGKDVEQAYYANVSRTITATLRRRLYDAASGGFWDGLQGATVAGLKPIRHQSIHATLFSMMAGAVDESEVPGMGQAAVRFLRGKGMKCSCMAAFWLLEGLYRIGWETEEAATLAIDILTAQDQYSWAAMLRQGATCTLETWPSSDRPGSGPGPGRTWSHPWCAGPNSVLIRLTLGVQPLALGWTRALVAPQPGSLPYLNATVPIAIEGVASQIEVSLVQTPREQLAVRLSIPTGTSARVCLPPPHGVAPGAAQVMTLDGAKAMAVEVEGRMLCFVADVGPGPHTVSRQRQALGTLKGRGVA